MHYTYIRHGVMVSTVAAHTLNTINPYQLPH